MREYQYIPHPETLRLEIRHRPALMLDQTTPQDVVPLAGTTFGLTSYDVLPTIAPGGFTVPAIAFTNSNLVGFPEHIGAIRGGVLGYSYDGSSAVMGIVHDFEASQTAIFQYNPSDNMLELGVNANDSAFTFSTVEGTDGSYIPVLGGLTSGGTPYLAIDSGLVLWDKEDTGQVGLFALSNDLSTLSFFLVWDSVNDLLYTETALGFRVTTKGEAGETATALTLKHHGLGDGSDDDGIRIAFQHNSDRGLLGTGYTAGYIDCIQTDATEGVDPNPDLRTSYLSFGGYTTGTSAEWIRLTGTLGTFNEDIKIITGTNTFFQTDELTIDLTAFIEDLYLYFPILESQGHETIETVGIDHALGMYNLLGIFDKDESGYCEILFATTDLLTSSGSLGYYFDEDRFEVVGDWCPNATDYADEIYHNIGGSGLEWDNGWFRGTLYSASAEIGDGTNYTEIKSDGEINLVGTARVYKNLFIDANALGTGGAAPASHTVNDSGFEILEFADAADDYSQANINVPADMDVTADCELRITWSVPNTSANMTWGYGYCACGENEDTEGTPTTGTTVVTSSGTADGKTSDTLVTISGGTLAVGDLIQIYFYRDVSEDTYGNPVDVHGLALKYVANKLGTAL